jgi:hypothetical protein
MRTSIACALVLTTLACAACSSASPDPGGDDAGGSLDAVADTGKPVPPDGALPDAQPPPPPFSCTPATGGANVLKGELLFDPKDPHPGDTVTVLLKSVGAGYTQGNAPKLTLDATGAKATLTAPTMITAGVLGAKGVVYHFEVPDVALGDVCLLAKVDGKTPELAAKITVTPRPAPPPTPGGVFKAITNHQFTCQEEVPWGNELHVAVLDENGQGVPNAKVRVSVPDTTDWSNVKNNDMTHPVPKVLTMGANGHFDDYFWWPANTNGFFVMELSVDGVGSDVATEITSGWWETDANGCRYCDPSNPINVWGHWSHRIEFRRDPKATTACMVPSDHAGQKACANHGHLYHDPSYQACWPAK